MAGIENFRTSLHGFHRGDVVQFIQQQTATHERIQRTQKEELTRLQEALNESRSEVDCLKAERDALRSQLEEARTAERGEEVSRALDTPIAPPAAVAPSAVSDFNELELAAYRRAEMTERMARERAAASAERLRAVFTQADEKLCLTGRDIATVIDSFREDYDRLQQLLLALQSIVGESSAGLKAAGDVCDEL